MHRLRLHRRIVVWAALAALVLASLLPALSHAAASASGASWVEVCGAEGSRWVAVDSGQPDGAPAASHTLAHCPCCVGCGAGAGLPPPVGALPLPGSLSDALPLAFLSAARTLHAWTTAQPRAPPRFS